MRITIATGRSNDPEIHRAGCADVARGLDAGRYVDTCDLDAESTDDVMREWWGDIIAEYLSEGTAGTEQEAIDRLRDATRFLPCAGKLRDSTKRRALSADRAARSADDMRADIGLITSAIELRGEFRLASEIVTDGARDLAEFILTGPGGEPRYAFTVRDTT